MATTPLKLQNECILSKKKHCACFSNCNANIVNSNKNQKHVEIDFKVNKKLQNKKNM